jgi:hypothetical protein
MPLLTKILKPEEFTAETIARHFWLCQTGQQFGDAPEQSRQITIDGVQFALDQMRAQGIIGE